MILRDFETDDKELNTYFHKKGFVKVSMPESAIYDEFSWDDEPGYLQTLSSRSRKHFKRTLPRLPIW